MRREIKKLTKEDDGEKGVTKAGENEGLGNRAQDGEIKGKTRKKE